MVMDKKADYILDLCRELQYHPFKRVFAVWKFAMNYLPWPPEEEDDPEILAKRTQQKRNFVEQVEERRKASKSADFSELPDLITDVLDRGKPL